MQQPNRTTPSAAELTVAGPTQHVRTFLVADDEQRLEFTGRVLGVASGQRITHLRHPGDYALPGDRCGACRWTEVTIYRGSALPGYVDDAYVVHTVGRSVVPGEVDMPRVAATTSPYEVLEILTVRRQGRNGQPGEVFMPPQHLRALALAAQFDDGIRDAYVNRAVV